MVTKRNVHWSRFTIFTLILTKQYIVIYYDLLENENSSSQRLSSYSTMNSN
jgi:hypothetical protein